MSRFVLDDNKIVDKFKNDVYTLNDEEDVHALCKLLNEEAERAHQNIELFNDVDNACLILQLRTYYHFSCRTLKILQKYHISSLKTLDRILFEGRVW